MSAGKKTLDDGFNGKNGKGDSKGSKQSSISATNVVVKKASQMSAGAYGRQDGQITDYSIIHKQKTLDYTDEGFTGKKGKGNSQGSSTSGTNMDVKKKPKKDNAAQRISSFKITDIKTKVLSETSRPRCFGVVQMNNAITESIDEMLTLVDHLPNEKYTTDHSEYITYGDRIVDEFEKLLTSIFKFISLVVDEPQQNLDIKLKELKHNLQSLFERNLATNRQKVQSVLKEILQLCCQLHENISNDITRSLSCITMSKENLILRSEHSYLECVIILTARLQNLESDLQRFGNIQSLRLLSKELKTFALRIQSMNEFIFQAAYLHTHGFVCDITNVSILGKLVRIVSKFKRLFETNYSCNKEAYLELHTGVQAACEVSLLHDDCMNKVKLIDSHIQSKKLLLISERLHELEECISQSVKVTVEQNIKKFVKPHKPLHIEKYNELLKSIEEYLSKVISYFFDQKCEYPTSTNVASIMAELKDIIRIDFMKLTVTCIIDRLGRIFNMQSLSTDADASDLITLGEGCKRSVQTMFCRVFESDDAIYKELKAEENFHKMEEIWRVCQKTVEIIIKFDKATGHGSDLTSNMDTLIKMVKEHLSVHILAIESKSSLTDYERKDFKSEYGDVMSTLMRTITSIIAKAQKDISKTSGSAAQLVTDSMYDETTQHGKNKYIVYLFPFLSLPEQEKYYCTIDFYVVIQCSVWNVTKPPEMHMKFLVPTYNGTKMDPVCVGPLILERELDDACVMKLKLSLSTTLRGKQIFYKYGIYSSEIVTSDELLYCDKSENHKDCYRHFTLPWERDEKTTVYNGCVYPKSDDGVATKIYNFLFGSYSTPPDKSNELETCFVAYLEHVFKRIAKSGLSNWTMVHNNYHTIQTVYSDLIDASIVDRQTSNDNYKYCFPKMECKQVLQSKLMDLIEEAMTHTYRPERIFSFLVLCRCFTDLVNVNEAGKLLSLLPSDMKYITEYEMLQTDTKDSQQYFNAMEVVIQTSMKSGALSDPSWVKAFPLYSWFCSSQKLLPNETLDYSPPSITEKLKSLDGLFGSFFVEEQAMVRVLNSLNHSLLEVDPMLRLALFHICPESKYSLLISHVPAPVILTGISMKIESLGRNLTSEMLSYFVVFLSKLLSEERNLNQHVAIADSLSHIVSSLDKSESSPTIYKEDFDKFIILCAHIITLMYQHSPEELKENRYKNFIPLITKWSSTRFGEHFVKSEHEFWLKLNSSFKSKEWEHILQDIVQCRIEKLTTFSDRVKVFESLLSNKDATDFVIIAIKNVIKTTMSNVPTKELEILAKGTSTESMMLLCNFMESKFDITTLSLEDILSWDLWLAVLKAHHDSKTFSSHSHQLCERVISIVKNQIYETLKSGEVSTERLCYLEEHSNIIIEISDVLSLDSTIFTHNLKDLQKKKNIFLLYTELCTHFISTFTTKYEAMTTLLDSIKQEQSHTSINGLCQLDSDKWVFPCFGADAPPTDMVVQYAVIKSSAHWNDLFHKDWQTSADIDTNTNISDVYHNIWLPKFTSYKNLVEKLRNRTITLNEMQSLFGGSEQSENEINIKNLVTAVSKCTLKEVSDIEWLARHISGNNDDSISDRIANILPSQQDDMRWISHLADEIEQWSSLQKLSLIPDMLLDTLQNLDVKRSMYKEIELFSSESIKTLQEKHLGDISTEIEKVLSFLKECLHQPNNNIEAIQKIAEYKKLREWIRSKGEDYNEIQTFIEVTMDTTAGEGDEIQNRLDNLSQLCANFSPIIFKLEAVQNLQTIFKLFSDTWKHITLEDPINTIDVCNGHLQWYLQIGELHGSVERGTKKQLEDINNYGEYHIRSSEDTQECVLLLKIESTEEQIPKKQWTLEDLLELESKLVLITRPKSPWEKDKLKFQAILHGVIRMKETIQKLKEYGYLGQLEPDYTMRCFSGCQEELEKKTQDFETTLVEWIKYVWDCRHTYYQLNFYTTKQLITLRKEITQIRDDKSNSKEINPHVFHLLQSVIGKPDESSMLLRKALEKEDDTDEQPKKNEIPSVKKEESNPGKGKNDEIELTFLQKEISSLNAKQKELFQKLKEKSLYDDELLLEAVLKTDHCNDLLTVMLWCGEMDCDEEYLEEIRDRWKVNTTNENIPEEPKQPAYEQPKDESSTQNSNFSVIADTFIPFKNLSTEHQKKGISEDSKNIISLKELGIFLQNIVKRCVTTREIVIAKRSFSAPLEEGTPNLIVVTSSTDGDHSVGDIFLTLLQIYKKDKEQPLPGFEEVLLCSSSSSLEEVVVFWIRALFDEDRGRIYCLVHAEKLPYLVAEMAMDILKYLSQGRKYYRLIIICSSEKSHIVTRLSSYRRPLNPDFNDDMKGIEEYLCYHITQQPIEEAQPQDNGKSGDNTNNTQIQIVKSNQSGAGKSLYIRRMKDTRKLKDKLSAIPIITVPLHGPVVTSDEILSILQEQTGLKQRSSVSNMKQDLETKSSYQNMPKDVNSSIIHIDVPQKVLRSVDDLLFSLLILKGLSNSSGQIWRCLPTQLYAIEITLPSDNSYLKKYPEVKRVLNLLELLPSVMCVGPEDSPAESLNSIVPIDSIEVQTPKYQRVFQYLEKLQSSNREELEAFSYMGILNDDYSDFDCIRVILRHTGLKNPTWKEVRHFVWFLNVQLNACEESSLMRRVNGLKSFAVEFFMKIMSQDFVTSSMTDDGSGDIVEQHKIEKNWSKRKHPYLFFNKDRCSISHIGLALLKKSGTCIPDIVDSTTGKKIDITAEKEVFSFLENKANVPIFQLGDVPESILVKKLATFMGIKAEEGKEVEKPDDTYVLTNDNLIKIMGIQMRFRCGIPVVLMGETGCGKTHLIRFMCKFAAYAKKLKNMFIVKVHGGTTEEDVIKCLHEAIDVASENRLERIETVVFFDEANTSEVISLIKEIMCDGKCKGITFPPFLKFVAACNPYRRHSKKMIEKLKGAGLGWHDCDTKSTTEKIGDIALRDLVYRVHDLPASMRALVYDFGSLSNETEKDYICQIVRNRIEKLQPEINKDMMKSIADVLCNCQSYMKGRDDECSFVSLRDVERIMLVFGYFLETYIPEFEMETGIINKETWSLVLAIGVCYHAKMEKRSDFEKYIYKHFCSPLTEVTQTEIQEIIKKSQEALLDSMIIQDNIARNKALRENIFMMFVCIELRIPLFLVGKPGSSKSLAKTIIQASMRGEHSKKDMMRKFKQVHIHSHQCSPLSTPASITEVFVSAKKYQTKKDTKSFVSVVVLDEVGLAEASPYLPLKALHPLLEDGTEGSGSDDKHVERDRRVAFIGISNWALDPAKMNRGIMVTRGELGIADLIDSAMGICSNIKGEGDNVLKRLKQYFPAFAHGYSSICTRLKELQKREFYGLRDFYSLIKMLCWMSQKSGTDLTKAQLEHAIKRNFSGYSDSDIKPYETFMSLLHLENTESAGETKLLKLFKNHELVSLSNKMNGEFVSMHDGKLQWCEQTSKNAQFIVHVQGRMISLRSVVDREYWITISGQHLTCTKSKQIFCIMEHQNDLISICDSTSSGQSPVFAELDGVNYFFPVIPNDPETNPDNSPLGLIKRSLITVEKGHGESRYLLFLTEDYSAVQTLKNFVVKVNKMDSHKDEDALEPFVLFGSSFPKDSEYAQVCRNISEIRLCMEAGRMVILLNLENLYESLYDVLNQYYIESGGHRYVDLGLRAHRMKCRVHKNFKLILIAEREKVYNDFPTPLINRLEKHFVTSKTVLRDWQQTICSELQEWVKAFVNTESGFQEENVFVGYNQDTAAAVVLQASADLEDQTTAIEGSDVFKKEILDHSKQLLLQLATPDSIIRATGDKVIDAGRKLHQIYFMDQQHSSLSALITVKTGSLLQVTTHSPSLLQEEIEQLRNDLEIDESNIDRHHLESFQTEQEFLDNIDKAIEKGRNEKYFLILECDSGHLNGNLISCCRYRIVDKYYKARDSSTRIILLIHLPRKYPTSNFVSFQSQPWHCCHIDDITETSISVENLVINNKPLSEVFYSDDEKYEEVSRISSRPLEESYSELSPPPSIGTLVPQSGGNMCRRLHYCIHDALSKIESDQSTTQRLEILKRLITEEPILPLRDQNSFYAVMVKLIKKILQEQEQEKSTVHSAWITDEARNIKNLKYAGTLKHALIRRFDNILVPVLSEIIAFVDQYCNLNLLESPGPMSDLWLCIFRSDELCQSKLCQVISALKSKHQGCVVKKDSQKSEFPFSWIIYSYVKKIMDTADARKNDVDMFRDGPLEQILKETPSDCVKDMLPKYIHDFIQLTQASIQITKHYKPNRQQLLQNSILVMIQEKMASLDQVTLLQGIITVHQQYKEKQKLFEWFSELISQMPQILDDIKNDQSLNIEDLVVTAVHEAVHSKYTNTSLSETVSEGSTLRSWIHKQYDIHQIINSILDYMRHHTRVGQITQKWQWICTIRMFVENVVLKNEKAMALFASNLQMYSEKDNLQTGLALKKLAILLNAVEKNLKSGNIQVPPEQKDAIHNSCWTFFMEVLSDNCFGIEYPFPDRDLVSHLLDSVFPLPSIKRSEPVIHNFLKYHKEKLPEFQSFMVKMLLRYELTGVKHFLNDIITSIDEDKLTECMQQNDVASLMIEYFKDQLAIKSSSENESGNWIRFAEILIQGHSDFMSSNMESVTISPDCLNAVAQMTFSMHKLALLINSHYMYTDLEDDVVIKYFVDTAKQLLSENSTFTDPVWFLTRFIARHFGVSLLLKTLESNNFKWILPMDELKHESYHFIDPAAIYNPIYERLRSALSSAKTGDISELQKTSENLKQIDVVPLALAFYERVRLSHVSGLPSKKIEQDVISQFIKFVEHCKLFTGYDEILKTVKALINNNQCTGFDLMQARKPETPKERLDINEQDLIRTIIVHSVLAVLANRRDRLIKVLFALLTSPETLKDTLLPAMAFNIPRRVSDGEEFPKCSSGHRHASTMVSQLCPHCGNMIHERKKNTPAVQQLLPNPIASCGYIPVKEGDTHSLIGHLSSASYSIIRIIIHSCLLWGECNEKDVLTLTNEVLADDIPTYFWEQVKCDLDSLCKATGRSIDEVALITHLVLREITQKDHGIQKSVKNLDKLTTQEDRVLWEKEFDDDYIKPVLEDVDRSLQHMLQILTVRDHNKLFAAVYETNTPSNETNFLWRFYPQVSLDHFLFNIVNLQLRIEHPVIYMYLTEQQSLKATQFIPDIVCLQKLIQENVGQKYDESTKGVIENMTFKTFTEENPNDKDKLYQLLSSLQQAWKLSRHNLFTYDRLDVPKECIFDEITDDIQMIYLIPTTYGKGVITTALVDFLVNIHNGFIIQSREFVEESLKRELLWPARKVPVMDVDHLHLIDCDKTLFTLLCSHCTRMFHSGSCQIKYDVAGLEKELVLKYIMGKPTITSVSGIPKLVWQKTVQTALTIRGVQKNVPQKPLTQPAKAEILSELKTTSLLTSVCEIVEIVMRLLQRRGPGVNPKKKLRIFIEKDLGMVGRLRSEKVSDYCCLEHVVSLWKFISVERTRDSVRNTVLEPFEDDIPIWLRDELKDDEASLKKALSKMEELESLLEMMFEFIQVQSSMQYYCNEEGCKPLRDELERFVEQTGSVTIQDLQYIPADITVSQVVATWKSIVKHQDSLKKQNY